jgi:hypothetical protein
MAVVLENRVITVADSRQTLPSHPTQTETVPFEGGTRPISVMVFPEGTSAGRVTLKRSIVIQMETTADGYVISSRDVDEDGYGRTPDEAVVDFLSSLYDRYQSLSHHADVLADHDRAILSRLRDVLGVQP